MTVRSTIFAYVLGTLIGLLIGPVAHASVVDPPDTSIPFLEKVRERIRTRIEAERQGLNGLDATLADRAVMRFYERRGFQPAWVGDNGPSPAAAELARALAGAREQGLQPDDYHASAVDSLRRVIQRTFSARAVADPALAGDFELLCTDAYLLYGSHLLGGRTNPVSLAATWNLEGRRADLVAVLEEALASGEPSALSEALTELEPPEPEYQALRAALDRYRSVVERGGWTSVPDGPKLEVGQTGDRVRALRARLMATGDLVPGAGPSQTSEAADRPGEAAFDAALKSAVERFQERHGLDVDGVVGPATLRALNVPAEARMQQIVVNLERWRWLPNNLGAQHIRVNIAGYWMQVIEDGEDVLSMRVIAGRPYRQTPVFTGQMSYLVFNPYWHVPHNIAVQDKLPEIKKDPSYLARQNVEVFRGWGSDGILVDPATVDWSALAAKNFPYRLRQKPGPQNALGQVKFMFPNPHNVYLHDTPTRGLFARAERNFSSGCIRLERPIDLAVYLLADEPGWSLARIQQVLSTSAEQTVVLRRKVPVHLLYWTAWAEDDVISFRNDVYDRDRPLLEALRTAPPLVAGL